MSKHRKGGHDEEHVNHERWLVTYADLITLLLAFFVILYSMSNMDAEKYKKLAESLGSAFGGKKMGGAGAIMGSGGNTKDVVKPEKTEKKEDKGEFYQTTEKISAEFQPLAKKIASITKENNLQGQVIIREEGRGLVLELVDTLLFNTGSADLPDSSVKILTLVGRELTDLSNPIRVEGHTDTIPISTPFFPNNWFLSTSRAMKVVMLWDNMKLIPADRLSGAGYGPHRPIADNATPQGRAKNRRVDIVVIRKSVAQQEPEINTGGTVKGTSEAKENVPDETTTHSTPVSTEKLNGRLAPTVAKPTAAIVQGH